MTASHNVRYVVLNDKPWPKGYLGGECDRTACLTDIERFTVGGRRR